MRRSEPLNQTYDQGGTEQMKCRECGQPIIPSGDGKGYVHVGAADTYTWDRSAQPERERKR